MLRITLICALALVLAVPAGAAAMPLDAPPAVPVLAVHPVDFAHVGYGEWAARYGHFRRGHVHEGQDVFAPAGTPLVAVRDAVVIESGSGDGRGNYVALYSPTLDETYVYFHMLYPTPRHVSDHLRAGERVGSLGCSGSCDGYHLHFELRRGRGVDAPPRDPLAFLRSLPRLGS